MIGTIRCPSPSTFARSLSRRTKAIVVAISCAPEPLVITAKSESCGWGRGFDFDRLLGTDPPSSALFSIMYWNSGDSFPGWKYGGSFSSNFSSSISR